jgi:ATP-dependent helicase HrpB
MDKGDLELIYYELCQDCVSEAEILRKNLYSIICAYVGMHRIAVLDYMLPVKRVLPNGKTAKIFYFESGAPELTARIGDLIGVEGIFYLADGRLEGVYNILAPNFRSVQKTKDLTGFWKNTYVEIKKELKRRYPKHPWP